MTNNMYRMRIIKFEESIEELTGHVAELESENEILRRIVEDSGSNADELIEMKKREA